jgi:hypothetical protein
MCNPSAMGSRQANSTIRALCRGGNLLRTPQARVIHQKFLQAALLVAAADAPDGGPIAPQSGGDIADALAGGDGQDDSGMLHLEPGQAATAGDGLKDGGVRRLGCQRAGSSTTHEGASIKGPTSAYLLTRIWCRTS